MAKQPVQSTQTEQKPKRKLPFKTLLVILGVLLLQAGTILTMKVFSRPSPALGSSPIEKTADTPARNEVEIAITENYSVDNHVTGRTTLVVTMDVSIKVKKLHQELVQTRVAEHKAELLDAIRALVAAAQPDHIKDPDKQILKREMKTAFEKIIGKELVEAVLIAGWRTYTGD